MSNELAYTRASRELDAAVGGAGDEFELARALERAAGIPLSVCLVASDLVMLSSALAEGPMSAYATDLCGVAQLASGACRTAGLLVKANLAVSDDDSRRSRSDAAVTAASAAASRLLEAAANA